MPMFKVITPVRKDGVKVPVDDLVELDEIDGPALIALGAVRPSDASGPSGNEKPLSKMNKAELLAVAVAEDVAIADDATNAAIVAAIEAKRVAA